jgi:hypothetical protein
MIGRSASATPQPARASPAVELDTERSVVGQPPPPTPIQPVSRSNRTSVAASEAATHARSLYAAGQVEDAAREAFRVVSGDASDDAESREVAQFELAKALYNLELYGTATSLFSDIADRPNHPKDPETLLWLGRLALRSPAPANLAGRVGRYGADDVEALGREQPEVYAELVFLLGRFKYDQRQFAEALSLFARVPPVANPRFNSRIYAEAQLFAGIANVQMHRSKPAIEAFRTVVALADRGKLTSEAAARLRDLATLSLARLYYSASFPLDEMTNLPLVNAKPLTLALKHWNGVDERSEYWPDAMFEKSWAYFMSGDYRMALGQIHTLKSPYLQRASYPEASVLEAFIYFRNCRNDESLALAAQILVRYEPVRDELGKLVDSLVPGDEGDEALYRLLLDVRSGHTTLSPTLAIEIRNAMSDRELSRFSAQVNAIDDEARRLQGGLTGLKLSKLGDFVAASIRQERVRTIEGAGELARAGFRRILANLSEQIASAKRVILSVQTQTHYLVDNKSQLAMLTTRVNIGPEPHVFRPDDGPYDTYVAWPFNGEYWLDELSTYRQVIDSKCGQ